MTWFKDFVGLAKDWVYMGALVVGGFFAIGFSVDPPWASAQEVKDVKTQLESLLRENKDTSRLSLQTQRLVLQGQLIDAEKEYRDNPTRAGQLLINRIKDQLEEIERALSGNPHP